MERSCRICGVAGPMETFTAREMMFGTDEEFEYFLCGSCGCLQIASIPRDMSPYYPDGYYSLGSRPVRPGGRLARALKGMRARYFLTGKGVAGRMLAAVAGPPSLPRWLVSAKAGTESRILDVGCGSGRGLVYLRSQGFRHLTGADPHMDARAASHEGVRLLKAPLEEVDGEFDIVLFDHSLEHIPDQVRTMSEASDRMAPGGRLVVRLPLVSSRAWREYGTDWVQLDAPRHLFLHSERSLFLLAGRAGLSVSRVEYDSTSFQFWGSEQYARGIPLMSGRSWLRSPQGSIFEKEDIARFEQMAKDLNSAGEGDQACFMLKRRNRCEG